MEIIVARAFIDDRMLYRGVPMEVVQNKVVDEISHNLAKELVKHEIKNTIVKREAEWDRFKDPISPYPATEYSLRVHLLTAEEYKEYQSLLEFQRRMQDFVGNANLK